MTEKMNAKDIARQIQFAELMLLQCKGEDLQCRFNNTGEKWRDLDIALFRTELAALEFRVKPKPRQRWICDTCKVSFEFQMQHGGSDRNNLCDGGLNNFYLSREVLIDCAETEPKEPDHAKT